jgi:hypothetical protein
VFFPGVRRRAFHLPHAAIPFALGFVAIALTLFAWASLAPSRAGEGSLSLTGPEVGSLRSVAYTIPGPTTDDVVVQPISRITAPRVVASFPNGGEHWPHAHGTASAQGDQLAVLWLPVFATSANLVMVDISTGTVRDARGGYDYYSHLAWSPDGTRLAAVAKDPSARRASVVEIESPTLSAAPVAEFGDALEVVPVGYSLDSERLFIVVVDQRGSNLYVEARGKVDLVAELSPGRTQGWALSPDGSRLAFTDVLSGGSRTHIGRTLLIATGAITTLPATKNQIGPSWMPGSPVPAFGGPGGSLQLTNPAPDAAYLVPQAWSPDGSHVAAMVYSEGAERQGKPSTALEIISRATASSPSVRARLSDMPGAEFLGFVRDLN